MAILYKCKMCGGTLALNNNETVATCEYCGTQQTLPRLDNERRANLYDRANHFRRNNDFDKAMGIYEQILNDDLTDAEAYWSIILCQYGIEYVEDPATHERVPTINRAQFTSIFDDNNYKAALQYADGSQRSIYEKEAHSINEIHKGILAISQKEEPFDVFICYKETDNTGRRTPDSVLANDLYHQLTLEGFKVFFSRITLEDKLGVAYEPYIFAALNSAKVMVVLGTKPEHFNAVWVKNEWSRYLSLIKNGAKKILIPAYRDMDPYDLPEEFSHLQAQDMSKLGFMQDLIRGIKKIAQADVSKVSVAKEPVVVSGNANTVPLLKRAFMFIEDSAWEPADEYCEKVLDMDPENAQAYLGKMLVEYKVSTLEKLKECAVPFDDSSYYDKVMRFADDKLKSTLHSYIDHIKVRNESARLDGVYIRAKKAMSEANTESDYKEAAHLFEAIGKYQDSTALAHSCYEKAEIAREEAEKRAIAAKKRNKIIRYCILITAILAAIAYFIVTMLIIPSQEYKAASALLTAGEYGKAEEAFLALGKFKDSQEKAEEARTIPLDQAYEAAVKQFEAAEYTAAEKTFLALGDHRDSAEWAEKARIAPLDLAYDAAVAEYNAGNYQSAEQNFLSLGTHRDSAEWAQKAKTARLDLSYDKAMVLYNAGDYATAEKAFMALGDHKDSSQWAEKAKNAQMDIAYQAAIAQFEAKEYEAAEKAFSVLNGYLDSVEWAEKAKNARLEAAYNAARKAYQKGAYEDAMAQFKALGDFRDSADQVKNCAAAIERKKNQQATSSSSGSSASSTPSSPTQTSTPVDPAVEQAIANMQGVWEYGNYSGSQWRMEQIIDGNTIVLIELEGPVDHCTMCRITRGTFTVTTNKKGEAVFLYTLSDETISRYGSVSTYKYRTDSWSIDQPIDRIGFKSYKASDWTRRTANDTPLYDYVQEQMKLLKPLCQ